jgi:hypothetical protein
MQTSLLSQPACWHPSGNPLSGSEQLPLMQLAPRGQSAWQPPQFFASC